MTNTVFIASTQENIHEIAKNFLQRFESKGVFFENGEGLIDKIRQNKPDLIIIDKNLPVISGDELCYVIKNDLELRMIPILILITDDKTETLERCLLSGCDDYLMKPVDEHELSSKIGRLINIPHRKDTRILVRLWLKGRKLSKYFFGNIKDLSLSGMLFSTDVVLEKSEIIEITFFLPASTKKISMTCKVVRIEPTTYKNEIQYGIQFLNMDETGHLFLKDYLERQLDK